MKRFLCIFASLIILISGMFCLPVSAQSGPTVTVSTVTAIPGDTIVVNVDIENNPGIQAMTFTLSYDNTVVGYEKYTKGGLKDYTVVNHTDQGYVSFVNCESDNKKYNGTIFSVTFKVKDDAKAGEYPFKICHIYPQEHGENLTGCFANKEHTKITPTIVNGKLTVGETCSNSGHKFSEWAKTTEPSCTDKGAQTRSCTRAGCGHTELKETAALGHDFEDKWTIDKAATETEKGVMSRHCTKCSETKDQTFFDLEISEEKEFENKEETIVTPDKWEVLEQIIEEETKEAAKEKDEKSTANSDGNSDGNSGKFSKTVYVIFGAVAILAIALAVVFIIILAKRGKTK